MFARLKDTIRIITYREPNTPDPDAVIVEVKENPPSSAGRKIAFFLEGFVICYAVGFLAAHLGDVFFRFRPTKMVSSLTLVGGLGALLLWLFHSLVNQLQAAFHKRFDISEKLAPYFGHRIEETYRALRG